MLAVQRHAPTSLHHPLFRFQSQDVPRNQQSSSKHSFTVNVGLLYSLPHCDGGSFSSRSRDHRFSVWNDRLTKSNLRLGEPETSTGNLWHRFFRDFAQKGQLLGSYRVDYAGKSIRIVHSDYGEKNSTKTYSAERRTTLHPKSSTKALKKNPTGSKKTYVPQNSSKIMEILFVSLFLRFRVWKK